MKQGENNVPNTYIISVRKAGGIPVILPVTDDPQVIARMVESIDGLILTGGRSVDPLRWYGEEEPIPAMGGIVPIRDFFDIHLARAAVERGIPVLGICRGEQVLNVAFGSTLYQDIPSQVKSDKPVKHRQELRGNTARIRLLSRETTLFDILKDVLDKDNSYREIHTTIRRSKDEWRGICRFGRCPGRSNRSHRDGSNPNVLGVQFHPRKVPFHRGMIVCFPCSCTD